MKALWLPALLLITPGVIAAQDSRPEQASQTVQASIDLRGTAVSDARWDLPDAPTPSPVRATPKSPASPCPAGIAKPCALLGGRLYFKDQLHATEHDRTWLGAMSHPGMLVGTGMLIGSLIADYKTTRACIDRHLGHESNPLMGQSRAQELGVGISLTALGIFGTGKLKKTGNGNGALMMLWSGSVMHTIMAYRNAASC